MRKRAVIFLFFVFFLTGLSDKSIGDEQVCFKKNCFKVEIVESPEDLQRGLMFRKNLHEKEGMLFLFGESSSHAFWMKNTFIPLDIIWIDEEKKVVFIEHNALPCLADPCPVYDPKKNVKYVLEINGGLCQKLDIRVGEKFKFILK